MLSEQPSNIVDIVETPPAEVPKRKTRKNLPKHVTSSLKAWIIKHRHHPYPKDKDKHEMALKFDLSVTQINNWFINNRRRFFRKKYPANAEANAIKRRKAFKRLMGKKRRGNENNTHSFTFLSPGSSMSRVECQSSDTSESSLHYSAASSYSSPCVDLCQIIHNILQSQYPFTNQLAFLAAVTLLRDQLEKLSFIGVNKRGL